MAQPYLSQLLRFPNPVGNSNRLTLPQPRVQASKSQSYLNLSPEPLILKPNK